MKIKMLTKSIAVICAVGFFSSASVWAAPKPGGGGGGGGDTVTQVEPTCTPIEGGVNISWSIPGDSNHLYSYDITLNHTGNTWTYTVANGPGGNKALSHWLLEILEDAPPQCQGKILDTDPNASIGVDGSTGVSGVKWDSAGGTFTIVMDDNYQEGTVDVLAKSATYYGVCQITGPNCPYGLENKSDYGFE